MENFLSSLWKIIEEWLNPPVLVPNSPAVSPAPVYVPPVTHATVQNFCLAIQSREGYIAPCTQYPTGTSSWRHKNPGNLKGYDGNFLTFSTYEDGFAHLMDYVHRVMKNQHPAYPKDCSIAQFFQVYAPTADSNDPVSYAQEVSGKCGVDPMFLVKNLV